jgi:hypothetical protein
MIRLGAVWELHVMHLEAEGKLLTAETAEKGRRARRAESEKQIPPASSALAVEMTRACKPGHPIPH